MNRSEALFFSSLFIFLSFPTAFSQGNPKQTAIHPAYSQTHENSKQYFQNLLEKSGSIDAYYQNLREELQKRKTIREKAEFLSSFRKDPLDRLVLGRTPTHIGSQYLRSELTSRLEIEEETPELLFSLAFLVPRQESTYSDLRYKLLKKAFELAPGEPVIGFELGRAALERGNFEEAEELLRKYRPASSVAAEENDLAALYLISGRKEEALRLIRQESALPQTEKRIFSDQILLLRFGEFQAAEQLLNARGSGLTEEQKSFLTAVRYIFEGKKKEAVPILLRLATPEKLRQENESNIHFLAQKRLLRKYPDYSFLSLPRRRQNPIPALSVQNLSNWSATGIPGIFPTRSTNSDLAEKSLSLLLTLSQEDREAGSKIREQLEAIGYPYAELYTGIFLNLPLPVRLERIRELSRQHPNDPIYAEIQFQIEQQTQDHGSKKELLRILNLLRDNRFPSVLNVFQVIERRGDFSKQEKLEIFRSIAELIDSGLSIALPALDIYYEPEYAEIVLKKTGEFLKNHAKDNTHSEVFYMMIHAHLYHLMSQNRFTELCTTLEKLCANDVPLSFQEAAGIFHTEYSLIAYQTLFQSSDSAFLNYKIPSPDQRIPAAIHLLNGSGTWVPCTLDRVPTLYSVILNQLLARKRNPSSGRIRRGAPDVKPIDWNAFRTAVRDSKLPIMQKIAILNELGGKSEAVEMLKTAIAENRKPDTTFRLNALAFLLQLGETTAAERIAGELSALKQSDPAAARIGALVRLKFLQEKNSPEAGELIAFLYAGAGSQGRKSLDSFLTRHGYRNRISSYQQKRKNRAYFDRSRFHLGNALQRQFPEEYRKNKKEAFRKLRTIFHTELQKQRWMFYTPLSSIRFLDNSYQYAGLQNAVRVPPLKQPFEEFFREIESGSSPDDRCLTAAIADLLLNQQEKASALLTEILKQNPQDAFVRYTLFRIQLRRGPEAARENGQILSRIHGLNLSSAMNQETNAVSTINYVKLVLEEQRNEPMPVFQFSQLLNLLQKGYNASFNAQNSRGVLHQISADLFQNFAPQEDRDLAGQRRLIYQQLCNYGKKHSGLIHSAVSAELLFAKVEKCLSDRALLEDIKQLHRTIPLGFLEENAAECLCLVLLKERNFDELDTYLRELRARDKTEQAELFERYILMTRALLETPPESFESTFARYWQNPEFFRDVVLNTALRAAAQRKIRFSSDSFLLKKELLSQYMSAMKTLVVQLDFESEQKNAENIRDFFLNLYTFYSRLLPNPRQEDPVAGSEEERIRMLLSQFGYMISSRYQLDRTIREGFCLALLSHRMPPLPDKLRTPLSFQLTQALTQSPGLDLFQILKQTPAFETPERFSLPVRENYNIFRNLNDKTRRDLIAKIDACKEKTFGMKLIRGLCEAWNSPPLIRIFAESLPEIRKAPLEKRQELWEGIRRTFSSESGNVLRNEPELKNYPELNELIRNDSRIFYQKQYQKVMALKQFPEQDGFQHSIDFRNLYYAMKEEEPAKAETLLNHLLGLLDKKQTKEMFAFAFLNTTDIRLIRKLKEHGMESLVQNLQPNRIAYLFRLEWDKIPADRKLRNAPALFREFLDLFNDKVTDQTVFQFLALIQQSKPEDLAFLSSEFAKMKSDAPAVRTARRMLRLMAESAAGTLSEQSRKDLDDMAERFVKNRAAPMERQWLEKHPELFAGSPRAAEIFSGMVRELTRRTRNDVLKAPDAYANLVRTLIRCREKIGKEKFLREFSAFFRNCYEHLAVLNTPQSRLMYPGLLDFYTWTDDKAVLEELKEYTDLMTAEDFRKLVRENLYPVHTVDAVKQAFPTLEKEK